MPRAAVEDNNRMSLREEEHISLTHRDSLRVLALLENPPKPNSRMLSAARKLPKLK